MKPVVYHDEAKAELAEAMAYYESQKTGLGNELLLEEEKAIAWIQQFPKAGSLFIKTKIRKCLVKRFPYTSYYLEMDKYIWIAAVAHQKRRPGYWLHRKP